MTDPIETVLRTLIEDNARLNDCSLTEATSHVMGYFTKEAAPKREVGVPVCEVCGALVGNGAHHAAWHKGA